MHEYQIDVGAIEELQMIQNIQGLDAIFKKAKETIVNGEAVWLTRKQAGGAAQKFDEFTTLDELQQYKKSVYKYL